MKGKTRGRPRLPPLPASAPAFDRRRANNDTAFDAGASRVEGVALEGGGRAFFATARATRPQLVAMMFPCRRLFPASRRRQRRRVCQSGGATVVERSRGVWYAGGGQERDAAMAEKTPWAGIRRARDPVRIVAHAAGATLVDGGVAPAPRVIAAPASATRGRGRETPLGAVGAAVRTALLLAPLGAGLASATPAGRYRLRLEPSMVTSSSPRADFSGLVDEQLDIGDPPTGKPTSGWRINPRFNREFPFSATVDLGAVTPLATLWIFDTNSSGDLKIEAGGPEAWTEVTTYDCKKYQQWASVPIERETRYLRLTLMSPGAIFTEIALDAYSPRGWAAKQAEAAEAARVAAEKAAALQRAREEALKRPQVEMPPFGRLSLVDEVNLAGAPAGLVREIPAGASRVESILGRPARVLTPKPEEAVAMTVRLGRMKMLRPGAAYVLAVEYPEDAPRSMVVINTGNETSRGFHTGLALGDALHPKYVNNHVESLDLPLSGRWEEWTLLFRLHDRFPERGLVRGADEPRTLGPADGFDVTLAHFSAENDPLSKGAAAGRIRLFEVIDEEALALKVNFPPAGLPRRRLFWREEMADGLIGGKEPKDRGIDNPIEWYRHKAELMRFLGMNTYTKDLLEFGACQHWDPTPHGGNRWVYHNHELRGLWAGIVELMGRYGFEVMPYYEYSGSKGQEGLGNKRLAKPLTRDDAYTHIQWIESANADITDPDTHEDFRKMLDLTVINLRDKARFAGIWIRPRSQLPVGFGPGALKRFGDEANQGNAPTRAQLREDKALYGRYLRWWETKRRDFLVAMRDHLRAKGVDDAVVLFTGEPGEPGVGFGEWDSFLVTDRPDIWKPILSQPPHTGADGTRTWTVLTPREVAGQGLYKKGLLSAGLDWGGWEVRHARPADDPWNYKDQEGVLLTHAFNRLYTVLAPETMDLYRTKTGLAMVRHHALNEDMMFDAAGRPRLGYFVADIERAGPYCMQAEAVAVANGDPTMIGYLVGSNFGRGFPRHVRDFNANFLALPALPSVRLDGASSDPDVVVRTIRTEAHGTYVAVVNTAPAPKHGVKVDLKTTGRLRALAEGTRMTAAGAAVTLDLRPCQLVALKAD